MSTKSKIYEGAEVNSRKNGHGVITRIITKSTGYVEVRYDNGSIRKEMAFNLSDGEGVPLKAMPKKREYTPSTEDRIQGEKANLLLVNDPINNNSNDTTAWHLDKYGELAKKSDFINSLMDAWFRVHVSHSGRFSEKQAYYLAKFIIENENNI